MPAKINAGVTLGAHGEKRREKQQGEQRRPTTMVNGNDNRQPNLKPTMAAEIDA
jgi:hypothetical protein